MNISMENAVPSAVGALIALAVWPILRSAICFLLLHLPGSWRFRVLWRLLQIDRRRSNRLFAQHGGDRKERADIMNEQLVLLAPVLIEKPDLLLPDGGKFLPDKYGGWERQFSGPLPRKVMSLIVEAKILWCVLWHTPSQKGFAYQLKTTAAGKRGVEMTAEPESPTSPLLN